MFKENNTLNKTISSSATYEQKQKAIRDFSKNILFKHRIPEENLIANTSVALKAALIKLNPEQLAEIKNDERIASITDDYFIEYPSSGTVTTLPNLNDPFTGFSSSSKITNCTRPANGYDFGSYQVPPQYSYGYLFSPNEQYYLKMGWGTAFEHSDLFYFGERSQVWVIGSDINLSHPHIQIDQHLSESYVPGSPLNDPVAVQGWGGAPWPIQPFSTPMVSIVANTNSYINSTWQQANSGYFAFPMKDPNLCNMVVLKTLTHLDQSVIYFLQAFEHASLDMPRPSWTSGNYASVVLSIGPVLPLNTQNPVEQQVIAGITSIINTMANQGVCFVFPAFPGINMNTYFPYNLTHPNVFTVVGMDPCLSTTNDYSTPPASSYNYTGNVDVAAPGQMILAADRGFQPGFPWHYYYPYHIGAASNYFAAAFVAAKLSSWGNGFWPSNPNNWFINYNVLTNGGTTPYPTVIGY